MLNLLQQHCANRASFSRLLYLGMDRTFARQHVRRSAFAEIREGYKTNIALSNALGEGFSPSYVSQLLNGNRGIGDDVATKIETRLNLTPGHLDREPADNDTVDGLLQTIAPILDAAPDSLRRAVLALALKYEQDPAAGERIAAAIRVLAGTPDEP